MFHELHNRVTQRLTQQHTKLRRPIQPGLKLTITLIPEICTQGNIQHHFLSLCEAIVVEYEEAVMSYYTYDWRIISGILIVIRGMPTLQLGILIGSIIAIKAPIPLSECTITIRDYWDWSMETITGLTLVTMVLLLIVQCSTQLTSKMHYIPRRTRTITIEYSSSS